MMNETESVERRQWEIWLLGELLLNDPRPVLRSLRVEAFQDYRHALVFVAIREIAQGNHERGRGGQLVRLSEVGERLREHGLSEIVSEEYLCSLMVPVISWGWGARLALGGFHAEDSTH